MRILRAVFVLVVLFWCRAAGATPVTWDWKFALYDGYGDLSGTGGDPYNPVAPGTPFRVVLTFDPAVNGCGTTGRGFFGPSGYTVFKGQRSEIFPAGIEVNNFFIDGCSPAPTFTAGQDTEYIFRLFFSSVSLPENYLDPDSALLPIFQSVILLYAPFNGHTIDPEALRQAAMYGELSMRYDNFELAIGRTVSIDVVPEPSTLVLLAMAMAALTLHRRREGLSVRRKS